MKLETPLNLSMLKRIAYLLSTLFLLLASTPKHTLAQDGSVAIYVVQAGDNLYSIASRFNIKVENLMGANGITDPNQLAIDQRLIIPGLDGVSGVLDTQPINFGDSYRSLIRRTQIPGNILRKLNRIVSPTEFYVGATMIIPKSDPETGMNLALNVSPGETLLELAVKGNTDPWTLFTTNQLNGTWAGIPSDVLYAAGNNPQQITSGLPSAFISAEIRALPIQQGGTADIKIKTIPGVTLGGFLVDRPLHFFILEDGTHVALQGIHSLTQPGVYPLRLDATLADGSLQSYEQYIKIEVGSYGKQDITVDPSFLDPAVTEPELQQLIQLVTPVTSQRYWQGVFQLPVSLPYCYKDWFGTRRSYNGSDYSYFHSGLDFGVCSDVKPFDIYAPAPGVVVFTGPLVVRGNATVVDHGWGVYTGYWHQEEIYVSVGQQVSAGQLIGKIGQTGRVTGPHLHWEVWANGVQVNPQDWLDQAYP